MQQRGGRRAAGAAQWLSVSSIGSEAMQPLPAGDLTTVFGLFQYPQSDRRRCNGFLIRRGGFACVPFSILNRIGGDATNNPADGGGRGEDFQYPQSDRRRCNTWTAMKRKSCTSFQYPQSDRRRCNDGEAVAEGVRSHPFSILNRIGGDATNSLQDVIDK